MWYRLQPATYAGATVHLQYYVTDEDGFKTCDFARARVLPALDERSPSLLVTPEYLGNNTNYIIGNLIQSINLIIIILKPLISDCQFINNRRAISNQAQSEYKHSLTFRVRAMLS